VGITRAKEELFLTYANRRTLFGGISYNAPSRFLKEIPSELFAYSQKAVKRAVTSFDPDEDSVKPRVPSKTPLWREAQRPPLPLTPRPATNPDYKTGQKVRHAVFGMGVIITSTQSKDDTILEIAFPELGVKKLLLSMTKLEKI
jgi:DNA helicase-2/ATP-dependent DNA helicase PcrA